MTPICTGSAPATAAMSNRKVGYCEERTRSRENGVRYADMVEWHTLRSQKPPPNKRPGSSPGISTIVPSVLHKNCGGSVPVWVYNRCSAILVFNG